MTEHPSPPCLGTIAGPIFFRTSCLVLTLALAGTVEAILSCWTRLLTFPVQNRVEFSTKRLIMASLHVNY